MQHVSILHGSPSKSVNITKHQAVCCQVILKTGDKYLRSNNLLVLICASLAMVGGIKKEQIRIRHYVRRSVNISIDLEFRGEGVLEKVHLIGDHIASETSPLHLLDEVRSIYSGAVFNILSETAGRPLSPPSIREWRVHFPDAIEAENAATSGSLGTKDKEKRLPFPSATHPRRRAAELTVVTSASVSLHESFQVRLEPRTENRVMIETPAEKEYKNFITHRALTFDASDSISIPAVSNVERLSADSTSVTVITPLEPTEAVLTTCSTVQSVIERPKVVLSMSTSFEEMQALDAEPSTPRQISQQESKLNRNRLCIRRFPEFERPTFSPIDVGSQCTSAIWATDVDSEILIVSANLVAVTDDDAGQISPGPGIDQETQVSMILAPKVTQSHATVSAIPVVSTESSQTMLSSTPPLSTHAFSHMNMQPVLERDMSVQHTEAVSHSMLRVGITQTGGERNPILSASSFSHAAVLSPFDGRGLFCIINYTHAIDHGNNTAISQHGLACQTDFYRRELQTQSFSHSTLVSPEALTVVVTTSFPEILLRSKANVPTNTSRIKSVEGMLLESHPKVTCTDFACQVSYSEQAALQLETFKVSDIMGEIEAIVAVVLPGNKPELALADTVIHFQEASTGSAERRSLALGMTGDVKMLPGIETDRPSRVDKTAGLGSALSLRAEAFQDLVVPVRSHQDSSTFTIKPVPDLRLYRIPLHHAHFYPVEEPEAKLSSAKLSVIPYLGIATKKIDGIDSSTQVTIDEGHFKLPTNMVHEGVGTTQPLLERVRLEAIQLSHVASTVDKGVLVESILVPEATQTEYFPESNLPEERDRGYEEIFDVPAVAVLDEDATSVEADTSMATEPISPTSQVPLYAIRKKAKDLWEDESD